MSLTILMMLFPFSLGVRVDPFYAGVLCDLESRLAKGCSKFVPDVFRLQTCVFKCGQDRDCVGASVKDKDKCYHHKSCAKIPDCTRREKKHKYLSKKCANGGMWNPTTSVCSCVKGWVGDECRDLPSECPDLMTRATYPRGHYRNYITLKESDGKISTPIPIVCYVNPQAQFTCVHVLRNFRHPGLGIRTWEDYKKGFFVDLNSYWLGLEHWHVLSSMGYTSIVLYWNDGDIYRGYNDFRVKNESNYFSFTFSSSYVDTRHGNELKSVVLADCFGRLQNFPFSTMDKDSDGVDSRNCAKHVGGAGWFSGDCNTVCNIFGISPDLSPKREKWMRIDSTYPAKTFDPTENVGILIYLTKP